MVPMAEWKKRLLLAGIAAAAVCGRIWFPGGAGIVSRWMTGPADNRVSAAFAALDDWMEQGFGSSVPVLWVERYGIP